MNLERNDSEECFEFEDMDKFEVDENPKPANIRRKSSMMALSYSRASTSLTLRLLTEIKESISSFRPSESLAQLTSMKSVLSMHSLSKGYNSTDNLRPPKAEIDVVISGGGLKGYFMAGCANILLHELRKNNVRIARISGASAGAWAG